MALIPETEFPGKITPSSPSYPYGQARNITVPGDGTGTPLLASLVNDLFGFQQAILSAGDEIPSGSPDSALASQYLDALRKIFPQAKEGKKYLLQFGALRNTGAGWDFIDDADHTPVNMASVSDTTNSIVVDYGFTADEVGTFIVVPDETLGRLGFSAGASVGLSDATIQVFAPQRLFVTSTGVGVTVDTESYFQSAINAFVSGGDVVVRYQGSIIGNSATSGFPMVSFPRRSGVGSVEFENPRYGFDSDEVTLSNYIPLAGFINYDGANWSIDTGSAVFDSAVTFSWDGGSAELTVTHPETENPLAWGSSNIINRHDVKLNVATPTDFKVRFYDSTTGALALTEDTAMRFYFTRPGNRVPSDAAWSGRAIINPGVTRVNPQEVVNATGNFWVIGIQEVSG